MTDNYSSDDDDDIPLCKLRKRNNRKNIEKTRCKGLTKKNEQCARELINSEYCSSHVYQKGEKDNRTDLEEEKQKKVEKEELGKEIEEKKRTENEKKRNKNNEIIYERQKHNKYICLNELKIKFEQKRKKQEDIEWKNMIENIIKQQKIDRKQREEEERIKQREIPIEIRFKEDTCCICERDFDNNFIPVKPCYHWVHKSCMIKFGSQCCPYCRVEVKFNQRQLRELKVVQEQKKKEKEENERAELIRYYHQLNSFNIYDSDDEFFIGHGAR